MRLFICLCLFPAPSCPPPFLFPLFGLLLSNLFFLLASLELHRLSLLLGLPPPHSLLAAALFVVNPASVFFSACYSESLFAYAAFLALRLVAEGNGKGNGRRAAPMAPMLAMGFARSNAFLYAGYVVLEAVVARRGNVEINIKGKGKGTQKRNKTKIVTTIILTICRVACLVVPFFVYDRSGRALICSGDDNGSDVCASTVSSLYGAVQAKHWNVGFLNYWTVRQIPNFVLALPMILTGVYATVTYLRVNWLRCAVEGAGGRGLGGFVWWVFFGLGYGNGDNNNNNNNDNNNDNNDDNDDNDDSNNDDNNNDNNNNDKEIRNRQKEVLLKLEEEGENEFQEGELYYALLDEKWLGRELMPHYVMLAGSVLVVVLFGHVQIVTRFVCASCPAVYWYIAGRLSLGMKTEGHMGNLFTTGGDGEVSDSQKWLICWFIIYIFVGTLMHSVGLPWT